MSRRVSVKSRLGELLWVLVYRTGFLALGRTLRRRLGGGSTRVLCYHRIAGDAGPDDLTPARFRAHLAHLRRRYRLLSAENLVSMLAAGESPPANGIVVTVDDGYRELAGEPKADLAAARATVFVLTADLPGRGRFRSDGPELMGASDLADLREAGVAIGSHTRTHSRLPELAEEDLDIELSGSRAALGEETTLVAYPWGLADDRVVESARRAGYRAGFVTSGRAVSPRVDPFRIPRIHVPGGASVARIACEAAGLVAWLRGKR